eukprot:5182304-Amphidinium_carterae.1
MGEEAHYEPTLLADSEGDHEEAAAALDIDEQLLEEEAHVDVDKEEERLSSTSETSTSNMSAELRRVLLDAEVQAGAKRPRIWWEK